MKSVTQRAEQIKIVSRLRLRQMGCSFAQALEQDLHRFAFGPVHAERSAQQRLNAVAHQNVHELPCCNGGAQLGTMKRQHIHVGCNRTKVYYAAANVEH